MNLPLSKTLIVELLSDRNIALKKRWGQNFLIDSKLCAQIVEHSCMGAQQNICEIGPGLGALTYWLQRYAATLTAIEIDNGIATLLMELLGATPRDETTTVSFRRYQFDAYQQTQQQVAQRESRHANHLLASSADAGSDSSPHHQLIVGNALKVLPFVLSTEPLPSLLFGNLPYSTAAKIVMQIALNARHPHHISCIVQKEVAERMVAPPASPAYSSLSVIMQWCYEVIASRPIHRKAFYPVPHVDSTWLLLKRKTLLPRQVDNLPQLEPIIRALFRSRRATLGNNIKRIGSLDAAYLRAIGDTGEIAGISLHLRAEQLSSEQCVVVAEELLEG